MFLFARVAGIYANFCLSSLSHRLNGKWQSFDSIQHLFAGLVKEKKKKLIKKKLENIVPEIKQEGESEREREVGKDHIQLF